MSKDKRLGRGIAALLGADDEDDFPRVHDDVAADSASNPRLRRFETNDTAGAIHGGNDDNSNDVVLPIPTQHGSSGEFLLLHVDDVEPNPFQPRREFGQAEIESLAESLREHEQLQPILVREVDGRFQLISGERRWRAAKKAGMPHVKAQVREADDRLVAELAIVENLQRKDLNPIEKALSFKRYLDEHRCTQDDLGRRLKIDRSTIANLVRLLDLPDQVQVALQESRITAGHARALLPLGDERSQIEFVKRIRKEGLSVRATEDMVQSLIHKEDAEPLDGSDKTLSRPRKPQIASLERELKNALGTKVDVRQTARGRGRIVVHFKNHDEFERLHALLVDESSTGG